MKMRPPVDLHLAVVEPVAPLAQTPRREKQRGRVVAHAHSTPVQGFHMHRPERLDGTRARVGTHPEAPPRRRVATVLSALLTRSFRRNSRSSSAPLRTSSTPMTCFIQRSNVFFHSPCRRQYSDSSIHFSATRRARARLPLS